MLKKVPNEFKVGVIATLAILLAVLGYNLLRGKNIFSHEGIYYARYDKVDGLSLAAHVRYNGMNIGRVQEMNLAPNQNGQIIVSMNVSQALQIPEGSVARIVQIDLFGTKAVQIELAKSNMLLKSGDTLKSEMEEDVISGVKAQASSLLGSLDSVVTSVKQTFNEETK
ncbi:MAG: MlaD family protein, partial [Chitinophagales bacterium]